jgi:S-formylglutathione hydrolase FrmB
MGTLEGYGTTRPTLPWNSTIAFPGARGYYWVYIPAQWNRVSELPLLVVLDGGQWINPGRDVRAWQVWDNLIARGALRPFIAIIASGGSAGPMVEYLGNDTKTSTFVLQELIPAAVTRFNLRLSTDRRLRAIGGNGAGAYGALKVAMQNPALFSRVVASHLNMPTTDPFLAQIKNGPALGFAFTLFTSQMDRVGVRELADALELKGYPLALSIGNDFRDSNAHLGSVFPLVMQCLGW